MEKQIALGTRITMIHTLVVQSRYHAFIKKYDLYSDVIEKYRLQEEAESKDLSWYSSTPIEWNDERTDELGYVENIEGKVEEVTVENSISLKRELNIGEYININGKAHEILNKSYGVDGTVYYHTDHVTRISDEKSKKEALDNLKKRREYLNEKSKLKTDEELKPNNAYDKYLENKNKPKGILAWLRSN